MGQKLKSFKKTIVAGAICTAIGGPAQAGAGLETVIKMLKENGSLTQAQYELVMAEIKAEEAKSRVEKEEMQAKLDKATNVEVKVDKGGLQIKSRDGEFSTKIGGRVQVDSAWYDEDSSAQGSTMGDGTEIRRARLYIQGKMYNDWGYKLQYDFTGAGNKGIKDAYLTYTGFDGLELKAGNFKDPFMLQEETSSKFTTFTERALPDAFAVGRHIGLMASTKQKHWTAALGLFGDSVSTASGADDEGWGLGGRFTYAPINEKGRLLHLGVAGNYRTASASDSVSFSQRPETHVASLKIVDTGTIAMVDSYLKTGLEFAAIAGPFSAQAEYLRASVDRDGADPDFDGWYAEAAWFLTGESRNYKKGKFGSITPKGIVGRGGIGAWQMAARYSTIDLSDAGIDGGEADSMALGVNWFATPTLRFSANYVRVLDVDGGPSDNIEPSLFQVRGQWAF